MPTLRRCCPIIASLLVAGAACAQSDPEIAGEPDAPAISEHAEQGGLAVWSLYWENDGAFFKPNGNTDRHYTNGARIVASAQAQWADDLANWLPLNPAGGSGQELGTSAFYSMGHLIFTPDRVDNQANAHPNDRPYAGWLYFSAGLERATETVADRIDLKIGVIGPASRAQQVQETAHDIFDPDRDPEGWDGQLDDRFALDLDVNRRWKFEIEHDDSDHLSIEFIPEVGFTVGTVHRHLMTGATLRIGSPIMHSGFGAGRLEAPTTSLGFPSGPIGANRNFAWSLYARVEGRRVFHNELLDGVDAEDYYGMVQVGVNLLVAKNVTVGYSQTWFSTEFDTQVGRDSIGSFEVSWSIAY